MSAQRCLAMVVVMSLISGTGFAGVIAVTNPSFEDPHQETFSEWSDATGWSTMNFHGLYPGISSQGTQSMYLAQGAWTSQSLALVGQPATNYTLVVDLKGNWDGDQGILTLDVGGVSRDKTFDLPKDVWTTCTLEWQPLGQVINPDSTMTITLSGVNTDILVDNVRLSSSPVPEPAALSLLGLALLGLLRRRA